MSDVTDVTERVGDGLQIFSVRRIDARMLFEVAWSPEERPLTFVCGPTPLVEEVATALVGLGHDPGRVKTERFGATGG